MPDVTGAGDGPLPHPAERSCPGQGENGRPECSKFVIPAVLRGAVTPPRVVFLPGGLRCAGSWRRSPIACPTTGEHGEGVGLREHMMSVSMKPVCDYLDYSGRDDLLGGGVRMVRVETPVGCVQGLDQADR